MAGRVLRWGRSAYETDADRVPDSLRVAAALWSGSTWVRETFGNEVQDHYANMARVELESYGSTVTDWALRRNFERF